MGRRAKASACALRPAQKIIRAPPKGNKRLKVILTVGGLSPEDGGPSRSIPALAVALARLGVEVEIVTCESGSKQSPPLLIQDTLVKTHLLPRLCRTAQGLAQTNGFTKALRASSHGVKDCIFHDNGLWLANNHAVAFAAQRLKRPLIISPRGMLTAWALHFRGWKKRVAWGFYQRRDLQAAQVLHATSPQEAEEFRALGLTQPIAVIPNGVEVPEEQRAEDRGKSRKQKTDSKNEFQLSSLQISAFKDASRLRTALFLSRIHPKKGLLDLVEAWRTVRPAGWRVLIAGGGENGHVNEIKAEIRKLKVENDFEFIGPVEGEAKWNLYRNADLFILPSHSENFGIVVAEALACGIPAITTQGTPWEELVTHRCGWWPATGSGPLTEALRDALARTDEERREMGRRGRHLVEAKYSWPGVAAQMLTVYQWMLAERSKPDWVMT
jgi:glycosyltransferase involved in cell wall biosynthesis